MKNLWKSVWIAPIIKKKGADLGTQRVFLPGGLNIAQNR